MHRWLRWKVIKSFGHWTAEEPISGANKYPNHGSRSHTREILFFFAPSPINLPKVHGIVFTEIIDLRFTWGFMLFGQGVMGLGKGWESGPGHCIGAWFSFFAPQPSRPILSCQFNALGAKVKTDRMSINWHCVTCMSFFAPSPSRPAYQFNVQSLGLWWMEVLRGSQSYLQSWD